MLYLENVSPPWLILKQLWKESLNKLLCSSPALFHFVATFWALPENVQIQDSLTQASCFWHWPGKKGLRAGRCPCLDPFSSPSLPPHLSLLSFNVHLQYCFAWKSPAENSTWAFTRDQLVLNNISTRDGETTELHSQINMRNVNCLEVCSHNHP